MLRLPEADHSVGAGFDDFRGLERRAVSHDHIHFIAIIVPADPAIAPAQVRLEDPFRLALEAANGDPVVVDYGFTMAEGWELKFELFRVFLPKPKYAVSGPGGVEASFDWRAAYDDSEGTMLRAHLLNDVTSYT